MTALESGTPTGSRWARYLAEGRRSLFLKLFLSIWVINILSMLLVFGMTIQATRGQIQEARQQFRTYHGQVQDQMLRFFTDATLRTQSAKQVDDPQITLFLFDQNGRQLSGDAPPTDVLNVLAKLKDQDRAHIFNADRRLVVARRITDEQGASYQAAAIMPELPRRPKSRLFPLPRIFKAQLLITFIGFGLACYWLTRHFTTTVGKLRQATRQLAEGNLSIRVAPTLPNREDELNALALDFDRMAQRIQHLMEDRQLLLRNISHELRSPLARLSVALGIAKRGAPEQMQPPLNRIDREADRLNTLIGQILSLNRFESPVDQRLMSEVNLCQMIDSIVSDAVFEAQARAVTIEVSPCDEKLISGAVDMLYAAVENVLRNAIQYASRGSKVKVDLKIEKTQAQAVEIIIKDRGPGVPEELLSHLFEPFFRVADDRNRRTGGSGIGLAIAQQAIRNHGGTIHARNRSGGGLEIVMRLPIRPRGNDSPANS